MVKVKCRDPRTGIVYVYSSEGYFDEQSQKYKYRRRVIGKLDENGNEIPTGPRGRPRKEKPSASKVSDEHTYEQAALLELPEHKAALSRIEELEKKVYSLESKLTEMRDEQHKLQRELSRSARQISEGLDLLKKATENLG